jgi:exopolyphosphatase/guanosine-5'-triphosphate,3'-diphosphate pyrophosphatase
MGFDFVAFTSGTASALAGLLGLERERAGSQRTTALPLKTLLELEGRLGGMRAIERARLPGLDARRGDTIYTGAVVLRTVLELTGASEAALCETALREGIIVEYVATNRPGILLVEEFPDLRRRGVMELARRCQFRAEHATHVARLALSIFHQTRRLHSLPKGDAELLEYAALLHDIGFHVAAHRHHRHTEYLIQSHEMSGFSRDEVNVVALVARYHRKAEPNKGHEAFAALSKNDRRRVRHLAAILRVADALDRTQARLVRSVRCVVTEKTIEMRLDVDGDPELELWAARRKGDLLEELTSRKLRLTVDAVRESENADDARGRLQVVR